MKPQQLNTMPEKTDPAREAPMDRMKRAIKIAARNILNMMQMVQAAGTGST